EGDHRQRHTGRADGISGLGPVAPDSGQPHRRWPRQKPPRGDHQKIIYIRAKPEIPGPPNRWSGIFLLYKYAENFGTEIS
ncbi:MAG: hypothetical protein ACLFQX_13485, partial [Candidatus Kapaibacterium sp.]